MHDIDFFSYQNSNFTKPVRVQWGIAVEKRGRSMRIVCKGMKLCPIHSVVSYAFKFN